jgi:hypothetical protein
MRDEESFQMMKQPKTKKRQYLYNVFAVATVYYNKQDEKNGSKEE